MASEVDDAAGGEVWVGGGGRGGALGGGVWLGVGGVVADWCDCEEAVLLAVEEVPLVVGGAWLLGGGGCERLVEDALEFATDWLLDLRVEPTSFLKREVIWLIET